MSGKGYGYIGREMLRLTSKLLCVVWLNVKYTYLYCCKHAAILSAYVDNAAWKDVKAQNWGDDLNYYLLQRITKRPIIFRKWFWLAKLFPLKNYLCIGSILDMDEFATPESIVWGTGVMGTGKHKLNPAKICSVRGKLSQNYCIENGFGHPNSVGDPALLLPCFYKPKPLGRRYKLGFVLHTIDSKSLLIAQMTKNDEDILVIRMTGYRKWTDVVDGICACDSIASTSLHGLITADAYGIANCWIRLEHVLPSFFKFHDYASSVDRMDLKEPLHIKTPDQIGEIFDKCKAWRQPMIDTKEILATCPLR